MSDFISANDAKGANIQQAISAKCAVCNEDVTVATITYGKKPVARWTCSQGHVTEMPWGF